MGAPTLPFATDEDPLTEVPLPPARQASLIHALLKPRSFDTSLRLSCPRVSFHPKAPLPLSLVGGGALEVRRAHCRVSGHEDSLNLANHSFSVLFEGIWIRSLVSVHNQEP